MCQVNARQLQIGSLLTRRKTGTNGMQLNNIIWIPKLLCNFNTISADMQSNVTKNGQQENIILNRRSVSFETTITKQSEITISPALLCVYALTKEKLIAAIPYEVLKEAEKIAKEELDKLKSKSMKFLKGTKDSQTEASTSLTDVFRMLYLTLHLFWSVDSIFLSIRYPIM